MATSRPSFVAMYAAVPSRTPTPVIAGDVIVGDIDTIGEDVVGIVRAGLAHPQDVDAVIGGDAQDLLESRSRCQSPTWIDSAHLTGKVTQVQYRPSQGSRIHRRHQCTSEGYQRNPC